MVKIDKSYRQNVSTVLPTAAHFILIFNKIIFIGKQDYISQLASQLENSL